MRASISSLLVVLVACGSDSPEAVETSTPSEDIEVAAETEAPEVVTPEVVPETTEDVAAEVSEDATAEVADEVSNHECEFDADCDGPFVHCKVRKCEDHRCVVVNAPNGSGCNLEACLVGEACDNGVCKGGAPTQPCGERECGSDSCNRSCGTCSSSEVCVDDRCLETVCPDGVKRVFLTSTQYDGDLADAGGTGEDGLAGGDALCALVAEAAGIGGTWRAWLSADGVDAIDRIANVGPWHTTGPGCGEVFPTRAAITVYGPAIAIEHDELGRPNFSSDAWTGTDEDGRSEGLDCEGWTRPFSTAGGFQFEEGLYGSPSASNDAWTSNLSSPCHFDHSLYCFEQ